MELPFLLVEKLTSSNFVEFILKNDTYFTEIFRSLTFSKFLTLNLSFPLHKMGLISQTHGAAIRNQSDHDWKAPSTVLEK